MGVRVGVMGDAWGASAGAGLAATAPPPLFAGAPQELLEDVELTTETWASGAPLLDSDTGPTHVRIMLSGWACREWVLRDGRRQIVGLMFPGDPCSYWTPLGGSRDHRVRALTACRVARLQTDAMMALIRRCPPIGVRVCEAAAVDAAVLNAWLMNLGQRKAPERIAHLFCELSLRLETAGLVRRGEPPLIPLTQQDLGDVVGMTTVHVNRVLQRLRLEGLIDIRKGAVLVLERRALERLCDFDAGYLFGGHSPTDGAGRRQAETPGVMALDPPASGPAPS
jgi:CRP-like cAMP-binding protein